PAASLLRARARLLAGRAFSAALDFGEPGNWLLLGNRYSGRTGDVIVLVNAGAWQPVPVDLQLPAGARALDSFGNQLRLSRAGGVARREVGRYPAYVEVPARAKVLATIPDFGRNIAPEAKVVVADARGQQSAARLTNGRLEFDFDGEPERVGLLAGDGQLPLDVTLEFGRARPLCGAILYGSLADNDKCTPLEYDLLVRTGGASRTGGRRRS